MLAAMFSSSLRPSEQDSLRYEGFRTGDLARLDESGGVELLGRKDDQLKISGRKVSIHEVEMALNRHHSVQESAVVRLPDPNSILEQSVHAYVVPRNGHTLQPSELLIHCRGHLEPYKVPSCNWIRTSLPKSPEGNLLRQALASASTTNESQSF